MWGTAAGGRTLILPSILIESCSYSQTLTVEFCMALAGHILTRPHSTIPRSGFEIAMARARGLARAKG